MLQIQYIVRWKKCSQNGHIALNRYVIHSLANHEVCSNRMPYANLLSIKIPNRIWFQLYGFAFTSKMLQNILAKLLSRDHDWIKLYIHVLSRNISTSRRKQTCIIICYHGWDDCVIGPLVWSYTVRMIFFKGKVIASVL